MTRFLHLSDLHLTADQDPASPSGPLAALRQAVQISRQISPTPAFVVVSGDLSDRGDVASYALLRQELAAFDMPVLMALGNHDNRAGFFQVFGDLPGAPQGPLVHDALIGDVHVVLADSLVPGQVAGDLDAAQIARMAALLDRHPGHRKLLVCHHPPQLWGTPDMAWAALSPQSTRRLAVLLQGRDICGLLCGHIHSNRMLQWEGLAVITVTGLQHGMDLTRSKGYAIVRETGCAICDLGPAGLQVAFAPLDPRHVIQEFD